MRAAAAPRHNGSVEPGDVLAHLSGQPKGRSSFKNMARMMGLKGARREALQDTLDQLVAEGRLWEGRRGHYRIPDKETGLRAGRFSQHPAGYGFVILDRAVEGVDGDVYIGRDYTESAMHDDRVLVKITRIRDDARAEGRIRRILRREQALLVGRFELSPFGARVIPFDERVLSRVEIEHGHELPPRSFYGERLGKADPPLVSSPAELDGMMVTVALTELPSRHRPARGRVVEALGLEDDFGVDVEVMIRKHHLPYRFSPEALEQAREIPDRIPDEEIARRRDFRDLPIVTIDGETARDFDDAVYVERQPDGGFALQVHIADVSHYVQPDSPLDKDAKLRGTSAYFPDRAVPMLPERLSTGICSLNPGVERLTLSALMRMDAKGELGKVELCRGVIRSAERMTYTNVFRVLEGDAEALDQYAEHAPRFRLMRELAEILIRKRERRGAVDLDMPEAEIVFDAEGRMTGVKRAERNIAHRIIEEFMLAANEAVARELMRNERALLHRVHETPSPKSIVELEEVARSFGHSLGVDIAPKTLTRSRRRRDGSKGAREIRAPRHVEVRPQDYQQLIRQLEGRPEQRVLSYRILRSFKQARYSEEALGHFALAADQYCHFTSPIRRYPDLVVHRALTALLDDREPPLTLPALAALADHASLAERRAADAERALLDWKKAKFMEQRLGDELAGMVVAVTEHGMWVELEEMFIEGFVSVDSFEKERFHYRPNLRALVGGRSKKQYGLGDRVRVRVDRVSWDRLQPELSCLGAWKEN